MFSTYDYRGYGKSGGDASLQGSMDDGLTAYDFVRHPLQFADKHIINYGESAPLMDNAGPIDPQRL